MKNPLCHCAALLATFAAIACGHSDPASTEHSLETGPYNTAIPTRLTFSLEDDGWPSVSGDFLSYRFEVGRTDRDFCAGLLPASGGQRITEVCAWQPGQNSRSDDFRSLVVLAGNRMAFTWHSSATGNQAPQTGGLYYGELGRPQAAVKVLDLLSRPAGASANWTYLIDPVQIEDEAFLVLASGAFIGQTYPFGPVDTVYQGVEIAKIDLASVPATVTSIVLATDAIAWTLDRPNSMIYFHRRYYSAPPGSGAFTVVADTVFSVPLSGGTPVARFGAPAPTPAMVSSGINGFAVAEGRLFVSVSTVRDLSSPPNQETSSSIVEVGADGTVLKTSHTLVSTRADQWGRLFATADGSHLVAEARIAQSRDLYLLELDS